ncbi:MAG: type II toxin-antitoxin system RelE/ParE family toxin [Candidatus Omnitrophota bacterium]
MLVRNRFLFFSFSLDIPISTKFFPKDASILGYRVIYTVIPEENTILILRIRHRKEVYR